MWSARVCWVLGAATADSFIWSSRSASENRRVAPCLATGAGPGCASELQARLQHKPLKPKVFMHLICSSVSMKLTLGKMSAPVHGLGGRVHECPHRTSMLLMFFKSVGSTGVERLDRTAPIKVG
eukprot:223957-Amphidinium_carterae.2